VGRKKLGTQKLQQKIGNKRDEDERWYMMKNGVSKADF